MPLEGGQWVGLRDGPAFGGKYPAGSGKRKDGSYFYITLYTTGGFGNVSWAFKSKRAAIAYAPKAAKEGPRKNPPQHYEYFQVSITNDRDIDEPVTKYIFLRRRHR